MNATLEEKLNHLPRSPGVYQHKDAEEKVLYVGKAKNLRNRVRSYFRGRQRDGRLKVLISKIADVEVIATDNEVEALLLEDNLIKRLQPRYNINLRDDKSYPYICIKNERFPRVFPTRQVVQDGSLYFGPYTDVGAMRTTLRTIRDIFKLRSCSLHLSQEAIEAEKFSPCLDYHIEKCAAPCVGYESEEHYNHTIEQIKTLLNGKTDELIRLLEDEMNRLAENHAFEEAAVVRDRIRAVKRFSEKQKVVTDTSADRDLFALAVDRDVNVAVAVLFTVREGKIIGRRHKILRPVDNVPEDELLQRFVESHYAEATFFPDEVYLGNSISDPDLIGKLLHAQRGKKAVVHVPQRGEKAALLGMVHANADLLLGEWVRQKEKRDADRIPRAVLSLERDLSLKKTPRRIDCFDISHLGGTGTVGSCIVFEDGRPRKSDYRTYKIRSVKPGTPDDFQSMREAVERRYARALEENGPWPDLLLIDGGKGQLNAAIESLRKTEVYGKFPVAGLAKRLEEVFLPGRQEPIHIPRTSSSLRLIQRVRDEAHRFAVKNQRTQRKKGTLHSELMDIDGIGAKSVKDLLSRFGSVKGVKEAPPDALEEVVGPHRAALVVEHFSD